MAAEVAAVRCIRRGVHPTPPPPHPPTEGARFTGFTRSLAEGMERAAERRTSVRRRLKNTVSTKPERSAQPLSASVPSGGPVQALPGPGLSVSGKSRRSRRTSQSRLRHIPLPSTTPTAGGSGQQPDPRTVRVSPSNLHRSTAPRRHDGRWPCALSSNEVRPLWGGSQRGG